MSNYTVSTNFAAKDTLASGNPAKLILGAQLTTEYNNIATAIATKIDGTTQLFPDGTVAQPSVGFASIAGVGMYNASGVLEFATAGVARLSINTAGNVVIVAPPSGAALTANSNSGALAIQTTNTTTGTSSEGHFLASNQSDSAFAISISQVGAAAPFATIGTIDAAILNFQTNAIVRASICGGGGFSINAPTSGSVLTLNGSATTNQSFGALILAGTTASDYALLVSSAASTQFLKISGDGGIQVGTPTGGDFGLGTINAAVGVAIAGNPVYAGIPINTYGSSHTLILGDANKGVSMTAGNVTIPANAATAFPIGTAISVINLVGSPITIAITTDAMFLAGSSATGTRTLAAAGLATLYKIAATTWFCSGPGVS